MRQPNILILHADQHRADCIAAYGNQDIHTPHIDGISTDGVRYDNSFCPFPVCTPSRYSLLTGQYVHQHLGWTNHCTLPGGIDTFPRLLRDAGYRTMAVGKMHFTPTYLDVGFEDMILAEQDGPGRFDDDYHRWLRDEGLFDGIDLMDQRQEFRERAPEEYWKTLGAVTSDLDERHHSTTWIADRAMEAIDGWTEGGNLLMTGFIKPHHPFDPPAPWDTMYDPDGLSLLPGWTETPSTRDMDRNSGYFPHANLTEQNLRRVMALYYGTISQIDHHIGRMIDLLKHKNLYDDTFIIYTGDHGDYMGFHHLLLKGNYMYDPLIKVPLLIKFPGGARAGEETRELVSNVDLAPTLLAAAGLEAPRAMGGLNLADTSCHRDTVFAEGWGGQEYMARTGSHKLLLLADEEKSQFFDLESDPFELNNRIADPGQFDRVTQLREALTRWSLFDAPSRVHLEPDASVIAADHLPADPPGSSKSMESYFKLRMSEIIPLPAKDSKS